MKILYYLLLFTFIFSCLNINAATKKKTEEPYTTKRYFRVREPARANIVKTRRSREDTDVIGIKFSGYNVADSGTLEGFEFGLFCACAKLNGFQWGFISCMSDDLTGFQWGLFHNYAKKFSGLQLSFVNRAGDQEDGWQIGIINFSDKAGIQFGLLNFKEDGFLPIFPFINF